jgi:hypothetical protein
LFVTILLMSIPTPFRSASTSARLFFLDIRGGRVISAQTPRPALSADAVKARLVGNWNLVKFVSFNAAGEVRPGTYDTGRLMYDGHEMTAHLMRSGGPREAPATEAARAVAYQAYLGYFGPYTVDASKGVVIHHVVGSSFPHWIGSEQVRYYGFSEDGNTLILSVKSGERITGTLTWERVK